MVISYRKYSAKINDIEFKMIRIKEKCWIKIDPIKRFSKLTSLHIKLNDEDHKWEIYDKSGREINSIYFTGSNVIPRFYLISAEKHYRVDFERDNIIINLVSGKHNIDNYINNKCNFSSDQSKCWANAVYYSKRPDKFPFNEM